MYTNVIGDRCYSSKKNCRDEGWEYCFLLNRVNLKHKETDKHSTAQKAVGNMGI